MSDHFLEVHSANWEERSQRTPGERLRLEPLTRDHAAEMAEVLKDPSLNEQIDGEPPSAEYLATRYQALYSEVARGRRAVVQLDHPAECRGPRSWVCPGDRSRQLGGPGLGDRIAVARSRDRHGGRNSNDRRPPS